MHLAEILTENAWPLPIYLGLISSLRVTSYDKP